MALLHYYLCKFDLFSVLLLGLLLDYFLLVPKVSIGFVMLQLLVWLLPIFFQWHGPPTNFHVLSSHGLLTDFYNFSPGFQFPFLNCLFETCAIQFPVHTLLFSE